MFEMHFTVLQVRITLLHITHCSHDSDEDEEEEGGGAVLELNVTLLFFLLVIIRCMQV